MDKTRLTVRMPPALAEQAAVIAEYQGQTMNAFIVQAVRNWTDYQLKRLAPSGPPSGDPAPSSPPASARSSPAPSVPKVGPNQPCPCGSGQKYKRCHGKLAAA